MAVGIVDALEMVDIAKGDGQWLYGGLRLAIVARQRALEGAAVGQAGEVIDFGIALGAGEVLAQGVGLPLGAAHVRFHFGGALQHGLGDIGKAGQDHVGLFGAADLGHLPGQGFLILAGGIGGLLRGAPVFGQLAYQGLVNAAHFCCARQSPSHGAFTQCVPSQGVLFNVVVV